MEPRRIGKDEVKGVYRMRGTVRQTLVNNYDTKREREMNEAMVDV